jgi:single-strand DNA-binding protein
MSRSLNLAVLIGHVGATPEVRTTRSGQRVATLSLATDRRSAGSDGAARQKTEWHRVIAWDELVRQVERVRRGERVYVEGRVEYRSWEDRAGRTRRATEIIAQDLWVLGDGGARAGAAMLDESLGGPSPSPRGTTGGRRGRPPAVEVPRPVRNRADDLPF